MTEHPSIIEGEETLWKLDGHKMKVKYTILPHASKLNRTEFKKQAEKEDGEIIKVYTYIGKIAYYTMEIGETFSQRILNLN